MLLVSIAGVWIYFHPFNLVDIDRSFVSWSFFFIGGFFFNLCKTDLYKIIRLALVLGIITLYLALYASIDSIVGLRTFLFSVVFIFVSLPLLIVQKNYQFTSLDKKLGDLSYPTYIIHIFILTYTDKIVSLVREFMFNGAFTFAITFGINLLLTTITSMILLRVIADPIEAFRNRIRGAAI
jgi:peptidoglycan/LPS O-acetylase OafA/YrhL